MSNARTADALQRSSLPQNMLAMYALQIANYLIPLLTLPYLLRVLGAAPYGRIAMAYAVVYFMVLFVDAGFNALATRRLAKPGIARQRISDIFVATQLIKLAQCLLMFLLLVGLVLSVPGIGADRTIFFATFPIVIGSLLFPTWLFQGLEIMHFTTLCSVGGRLLATIGIFVLVKQPGDVVIAALLQASATAMSGLLALPFILKRLRLKLTIPRRRLFTELRRTLADARAFAPAEYLTDVIANSGVFILGLFAGDVTVGVYAAIEKVARAGASLFQPLTKALFPALAGRWMRSVGEAEIYCRAWSTRIVSLALLASAGLAVVAPLGLELLFGGGWAQHAPLLRGLAVWLGANVTATVVGQFWLLARSAGNTYARCLVTTGTLQLFASVTGAAWLGVTGLVFAIAASELLRVAILFSAARSHGQGVIACAS